MSLTTSLNAPQISTYAPEVTKPAVSTPQDAVSPASTTSQADQTSLSSASSLVAQALRAPDVRADKVAALQQAINSGTYSVPASAVAGKIVDSLLT
jgi:negative regulator of flagellin synthesis FlgM